MTGSWLRRHTLELVPGETVEVEELNTTEAEALASAETESEGAAPKERLAVLAAAYATVAERKVYKDGALVFTDARNQLSFSQLQAIAALSLGTSELGEQVARFRGGAGAAEGVEAVPDGADVRVPSPRSGNGSSA